MDSYPLLKLIHIISATLLFGTGLGTAFFLFMANRSANLAAIQTTIRTVVLLIGCLQRLPSSFNP